MDKEVGAAIRLEACDDVMRKVIAPLSLEERLRLATVSKRWQRFLLAELRFPSWLCWRAPAIAQQAGAALRVLDVSGYSRLSNFQGSGKFLSDLVQALGGGSGAQLRSLIAWAWAPTDGVPSDDPLAGLLYLEPALTHQLRASCPLLDGSNRLAVRATGAAEAAALLAALPGRHALRLRVADDALPWRGAGPEEQAASRALFRHPRLCALDMFIHDDAAPVEGLWFDAIFTDIVDALSPQGQCEGCSLEHIRLEDRREELTDDPEPAFPDTASVAAAFGPVGLPLPECSLRSLSLVLGSRGHFVRSVLVASRGSLRHLLFAYYDSFVPPGAASTFSAAIERIGPMLETLSLGHEVGEAHFLPSLAPLLASPACHLRSLDLGGSLEMGAVAAEPAAVDGEARPFHRFLHALSANRSLRALRVRHDLPPEDAVLLAAALTTRACPLDRLYWSSLKDDSHPAAVVALLSSSRLTQLDLTDFSRFTLSCAAAEGLVAALVENSTLRALTLSANDGSSAMLEALSGNGSIQVLRWRPDYHGRRAICSRDPLSSLLLRNGSLHTVDLSGLQLSDTDHLGLGPVASALAQNKVVRFFALGGVRDGGHAAFVKGLRGNETLRVLCFSDSTLESTDAALLGLELASSARILRLRDLAFVFTRGGTELAPVALHALAAAALPAGHSRLTLDVGFCSEPADTETAAEGIGGAPAPPLNPFRAMWAAQPTGGQVNAGLAPWLQRRIHVATSECVLTGLVRNAAERRDDDGEGTTC